MFFRNIYISRKNYVNYLLEWDYEKNDLYPNLNNYNVIVSSSAVKEGPFQVVAILPASTFYYEHQLPKQKWITLYYKLEIQNIIENKITDARIETQTYHLDPLVKRVREKYHIYLTRALKNSCKFFKRKKVGQHCKDCWDDVKGKSTKDYCPTCFGTTFGDNSVLGLENLGVDNFLKINADNQLEFYKKDLKYLTYPGFSFEEDYGVKVNDELRIESLNGDPLFAFRILGTTKDSLILNYNNENFYNFLDNCQFSIYRMKEMNYALKADTKIVYFDGEYKLYNENIIFSKPISSVTLLDSLDTVLGTYSCVKGEDYLQISATEGELKKFDKIQLNAGDDSILDFIEINGLFCFDINEKTYYNPKYPLNTNFRLYVTYNYDGENWFKINNKQTKISEREDSHWSLALFSIIAENDNVYTLTLETLSDYETVLTTDLYTHQLMLDRFARQYLTLDSYEAQYASSQQTYTLRYLSKDFSFKIPDYEIIPNTFSADGLNLINLHTGKVYKPNQDFYYDSVTKTLSNFSVPFGVYELAFIILTKDIKIGSFFIPLNPVLENGKIISVDGWIYKNDALAGQNVVDKVLSISGQDFFAQLKVISQNESKIILEPGNYDPNVLFSSLTDNSSFSIEDKNTGGYYNEYNGYYSVASPTNKNLQLTLMGVNNEFELMILTEFYPNLEVGDLFYEPYNNRFFEIIRVEAKIFKKQQVWQVIGLKEKDSREQILLQVLNERQPSNEFLVQRVASSSKPINPIINALTGGSGSGPIFNGVRSQIVKVDTESGSIQLNKPPVVDSEIIFLNGLWLNKGEDHDYIIVNDQIIFNTPILPDDVITVMYR